MWVLTNASRAGAHVPEDEHGIEPEHVLERAEIRRMKLEWPLEVREPLDHVRRRDDGHAGGLGAIGSEVQYLRVSVLLS